MARRLIGVALGALLLSSAAIAQEVAVTPLAAPDHFSTAGRETGLGPDLWRGTSAGIARTVIVRSALSSPYLVPDVQSPACTWTRSASS